MHATPQAENLGKARTPAILLLQQNEKHEPDLSSRFTEVAVFRYRFGSTLAQILVNKKKLL